MIRRHDRPSNSFQRTADKIHLGGGVVAWESDPGLSIQLAERDGVGMSWFVPNPVRPNKQWRRN